MTRFQPGRTEFHDVFVVLWLNSSCRWSFCLLLFFLLGCQCWIGFSFGPISCWRVGRQMNQPVSPSPTRRDSSQRYPFGAGRQQRRHGTRPEMIRRETKKKMTNKNKHFLSSRWRAREVIRDCSFCFFRYFFFRRKRAKTRVQQIRRAASSMEALYRSYHFFFEFYFSIFFPVSFCVPFFFFSPGSESSLCGDRGRRRQCRSQTQRNVTGVLKNKIKENEKRKTAPVIIQLCHGEIRAVVSAGNRDWLKQKKKELCSYSVFFYRVFDEHFFRVDVRPSLK